MTNIVISEKTLIEALKIYRSNYLEEEKIRDDKFKTSAEFENKMRKLILSEKNIYHKLTLTKARRVLCVAAIIIALLISTFSVSAIREPVVKFIAENILFMQPEESEKETHPLLPAITSTTATEAATTSKKQKPHKKKEETTASDNQGVVETVPATENQKQDTTVATEKEDASNLCGENATWKIKYETGELVISGTGKMTNFESPEKTPWYNVRESVESVTVSGGITYVGNYAFADCKNLTRVKISNNITGIGSNVFTGCGSVEEMSIPFVGSSKKGSSKKNERLFGYLFGNDAYVGGYLAKQVCYDGRVYSYYIPLSLRKVTVTGKSGISYGAFSNCKKITNVTLNKDIEYVNGKAFYNCMNLSEISLPKNLSTLGQSAFENCYRLKSITIPENVDFIEYTLFKNCSRLKEVTFEGSLMQMHLDAFYGCTKLKDVYYGDTRESWNSIRFSENYDNEMGDLKNVTIHCIDDEQVEQQNVRAVEDIEPDSGS